MAYDGYFPFVDVYVGYPYYETGTLTVTNGDATILGSGTTWNSGMEDCVIFLSDAQVPHNRTVNHIKTFTDTTHMELYSKWGGSTVASVKYMIDDPSHSAGTYNWRIRVYPMLKQASGQSGSISTVIPLDVDETSDLGVAIASAMPLQNAKRVRHVDGWIYASDSSNKPGSDTIAELIEDIEALQNYSGILGVRMWDEHWKGDGGSTNGVIIKNYTIPDKKVTRDATYWKSMIQLDLEPAQEF